MSTNDKRASVLAKVKALLAKTVDNGCTEAEAMAALEKAQQLMDEHEVTEQDLADARQEEVGHVTSDWQRDYDDIRAFLCTSVANFTDTFGWRSQRQVPGKTTKEVRFNYAGARPDVEFAHWLLETLATFVEQQAKTYVKSKGTDDRRTRRLLKTSFVLGCCGRLRERISQYLEKPATAMQQALVVVKQDLAMNYVKQSLKLDFTSPRRVSRTIINDGLEAGKRAAEGASLGRPVSGQGSVLMIGGKV